MLYDGSLSALAKAKGFDERKEYQNKAKSLVQVCNIMNALRGDLDFELGGEVALNLDSLYEYISRICSEAGTESEVDKLDEAIDLIKTLKEGWAHMPDNFKKASAKQLETVKNTNVAV